MSLFRYPRLQSSDPYHAYPSSATRRWDPEPEHLGLGDSLHLRKLPVWNRSREPEQILSCWVLWCAVKKSKQKSVMVINICCFYFIWLVNWCCNTLEVQRAIHETLLQFTQNRKPNHITDGGIYFFQKSPLWLFLLSLYWYHHLKKRSHQQNVLKVLYVLLPKCQKYRI